MLKRLASLTIVPLLLLLWAQFGSQNLTSYSFHALIDYPSPYLGALAPGQEREAVSQQVVIVVVDALRADAARGMPALNALSQQGAVRTAQAGQPSFSLPGWTVIGTGAWQEQSGVTLNFYSQDIKTDTLFEAAKRKGLTTAIASAGSGWQQLYARGVDWSFGAPDPADPYGDLAAVRRQDDAVEAAALRILKESHPALILLHFIEADDAGHAHGATSAAYREAVAAADARIGRIAALLDLTRATLIVTSDHGMLDRGGHGGWEPEVMTVPIIAAGKGTRPGQYPEATQADLAPTIAVLLGTSIPAHNQGQPLFDMLELPVPLQAQRAVDTAEQIQTRYAQVASVLGAAPFAHPQLDAARQALSAGNDRAAFEFALADIRSTRNAASVAREARLNRERLGRLPLTALLLLPFLVYLVIGWRARWDWRAPVAGLVVYNIVYNGLFFGRGLSWSLSMFNDEKQIMDFFEARTIDAMLALVLASLVVGAANRRQGVYVTTLATINMAFAVAAVLAVQILTFYLWYDVGFSWFIPDLLLGLKYYLDLLQTGAFWPLVYVPLLVFLPAIALASRWVAGRLAVRTMSAANA